jgi:hypothetical protein
MCKKPLNFIVIGLIIAATDASIAHHSIFPFDQGSFVELDGVVLEMLWRNPHVRLKMRVQNDAGEEEEWELEGDSANATARRGLTRDSISVGTRIRVAGHPSNRGLREILLTNILMPNGEEYLATERPRPWRWTEGRAGVTSPDTSSGPSIFHVWSFEVLHRVEEPFVFTPAAQAARAAWDPFTDMLALRCIAPGMPNAMHSPYPIEFIDEGNQIRLRIEMWEATRLIDMVSEEIPEDSPSSSLGYAIGRWEGETLVVETANIDDPYLDDAGTPMSEEVRVVERFTLSENGTRLDYEVTVTDSPNLAEPAIEYAAWRWVPSIEISPYECIPE